MATHGRSSFSEEKEAKRLYPFGTGRLPQPRFKRTNVLWFFLSRKNKSSVRICSMREGSLEAPHRMLNQMVRLTPDPAHGILSAAPLVERRIIAEVFPRS
jgi:hypothetical protein